MKNREGREDGGGQGGIEKKRERERDRGGREIQENRGNNK